MHATLLCSAAGALRRATSGVRRELQRSGRRVAGEAPVTWAGELAEAALIVGSADTTEDLVVDDVFLKKLER